MNRIAFARTASSDGAKFRSQSTVEVESFSTLNKTPNVGLAGTLTTRTSDVAGVVTTTNSPAGNIATNDKVAIGWVTAGGAYQYAWYGTATVSGSAITVAGLTGTALPAQASAVVIAKIAAEPLSVPDAQGVAVIGAPKTSSRLLVILGLTSEVDNGTPDYTNAIVLDVKGPLDAVFLQTADEWLAKNADFGSADRAYVANISTVVGGNVQIVSGYN